jgi:hypothetical protein
MKYRLLAADAAALECGILVPLFGWRFIASRAAK